MNESAMNDASVTEKLLEAQIQNKEENGDDGDGISTSLYNRQNTFTRVTTFSRGFTVTDPRAWLNPDEIFTQSIIDEYIKHAEEGMEGDVPFPSGFARKYGFWKMMFFAGVFGVVTSLAAVGFMTMTDEIPKLWNTCDYESDTECAQYYKGEKYYIALVPLVGLLVGLLRWITKYPSNLAGVFKEIKVAHVHWQHAPMTFILSAISLAGGASLGPEAALSNVGGGMASWVIEKVEFEDPDDKKLLVLSGMSAALGALFPSPVLSPLMLFELGEPPKSYMEAILVISFSSCISFMLYYQMVDYNPYLDHPSSQSGELAIQWEVKGFEVMNCLTGFSIGVVSAALCTFISILIGTMKQVFNRLRARCGANILLREILPPISGGFIIGICNYALPLSVGNGSNLLGPLIKYGINDQYSTHLLIATGFVRALTLSISMNCGFVGGIIFPMVTMGAIAGTVCTHYYDYLPYGLCLSCFMAGVPAGVCPMPITLLCLIAYLFFFGLYQTAPLFIATLTSYAIVCGTGLMKKLSSRNQAIQANQNKGNEHDTKPNEYSSLTAKEKERQEKEAEQFAMNHYLATKKSRFDKSERN